MYSFIYMKLVQNLVQQANVNRLWHHFFHSGSCKDALSEICKQRTYQESYERRSKYWIFKETVQWSSNIYPYTKIYIQS